MQETPFARSTLPGQGRIEPNRLLHDERPPSPPQPPPEPFLGIFGLLNGAEGSDEDSDHPRPATLLWKTIEKQPNILMPMLKECKWWTRGWTLQELVAPSNVQFYDSRLEFLGTKKSLIHVISEISKIDRKYLAQAGRVSEASIAQRMSWASSRITTRDEDIAYCLLGIFEINMPLLYGEGKRAFFRLQQAIIGQSNDQSIFAWTTQIDEGSRGILANDPSEFAGSGHISLPSPMGRFSIKSTQPYQLTNAGLEFYAPVSWHYLTGMWHSEIRRNIITLKCVREHPDDFSQPLPVAIQLHRDSSSTPFYRRRTTSLDPPRSYVPKIFETIYRQHYIALQDEGNPEPLSIKHLLTHHQATKEVQREVWFHVVRGFLTTLLSAGVAYGLSFLPSTGSGSWSAMVFVWAVLTCLLKLVGFFNIPDLTFVLPVTIPYLAVFLVYLAS